MRLSGRKPSSFTRRWTQRQRFALLALIGANVGAFVVQLVLQGYDPTFVREYLALSDRGIRDAYAWQFFTAILLHDGPWDLLGNMLILYLLGRDLESILGQRHFLFLYFMGAISGELGHLFLMPSNCALFGAAGGVAAVLVAYATILPELELTSMVFFTLPLRLKAKHLAYGVFGIAVLLVIFDRSRAITHSAYFGGCVAGWFYAHLLGFGRPSFLQRMLWQRRAEAERLQRMSTDQFVSQEIDPLLEKISREGLSSLTRAERRKLAKAREKIAERTESR
jgi:membrane associated rhomboid family serine protease